MANIILMSDCSWCGETYIKQKIGDTHGCEQEKNPQIEQVPEEKEDDHVITLGGA